MRNVVGVDLSLTATGVADADGSTSLIAPAGEHTSPDGLAEWLSLLNGRLADIIWAEGGALFVVEDLPRNPRFGGTALGMVHGLWRASTWRWEADVVYVPPASLKRYACGKGNASKAEVLTAAVRRLGYLGADDNEADALWLRAMGLDALGTPPVKMPAANRDALTKLEWPAR